MIKRLSAYAVVIAVTIGSWSSASEHDDSMILIRGEGLASTMYRWQIPRSSVAALPSWDPLTGQVPLSPQRACVAATKFLRDRFGPSPQLTIMSICLAEVPVGPRDSHSSGAGVWDYQILFDCEPHRPSAEVPLLNVMVLMDGKVVIPVTEPYK